MGRFAVISGSMAAIMAITSVDLIGFATAAQARGHGGGSHMFSSSSSVIKTAGKSFTQRVQKFTPRVQPRHFVPKNAFVPKKNFKAVQQFIPKGSAKSLPAQQILVQKNLPQFKAVAGNGQFKSRLALPQNFAPKLTLIKAPKLAIVPKFQPFIQRHWKSAFFWVAVAGIGYVTIPEFYYDRWVSYVDEPEPDYDRALSLLSLAALDDEENIVRIPKPENVPYRYTATIPPPAPVAVEATTDPNTKVASDAGPTCTLKPFVERQWSQSFVWVQIPEVGNVTVPEDSYDRFISSVSSAPPNYGSACAVLAEAAAADTVTAAQTSSVN